MSGYDTNKETAKKRPPEIPAAFNFAKVIYFVSRTAIPGRVFPSRNSREAPPPVETWLIFDARLNLLTAATESPPPTTETAPFEVASATRWATSPVPFEKASNSNTPTGPFQTMDFEFRIVSL